MTMTFRSDMTVKLVDSMGNDRSIIRAAIVSNGGDIGKYDDFDAAYGLINYLMKHKHSSPFEHGAITIFVDAPIFVWREFHRHRTFSYNESSARYKQLEPVFWIPDRERAMAPSEKHTSARPDFIRLENDIYYGMVIANIKKSYELAYSLYECNLAAGIAKEVARCVLPVGIYSQCYVTANPRNWLQFFSLRVRDERARFPTYPQWEIQDVAMQCEKIFQSLFPLTHKAYIENGRCV